jgi:hypothetical protein
LATWGLLRPPIYADAAMEVGGCPDLGRGGANMAANREIEERSILVKQ